MLIVPILTDIFKLSQHKAHGTSLAIIGVLALVSCFIYALHGNVDWSTAIVVAIASILSARFGARLAVRTSPRRLTGAFAIFLAVVALRMLWKVPDATTTIPFQGVAAIGVKLGIGVLVGLLSGYMGVGGGIIAVPLFTFVLMMPQQMAQGTSLAVILGAAPAGAIEHARHGNVVGRVVPLLALGGAVGGPIASVFVQDLPHAFLARAFAVFLILNAVRGWIRASRPAAA